MIDIDRRIPFALLAVNVQGDEARNLVKKRLVEIALFLRRQPQTKTRIAESIGGIMNLGGPYSEEATGLGLNKALEYKTVTPVGGACFALTSKGSEEVEAAKKVALHGESAFRDYFRTALPECANGHEDSIVEAFQLDLQRYLNAKANELTYKIEDRFDGDLGVAMSRDAFSLLDRLLEERLNEHLDRQKVRASLRKALSALPQSVAEHVASLHRRCFYYKLLVLDPDFRRLQQAMLSNWSFYLDTNLILSLLVPTRADHKRANGVILGLANAGSNLYVTGLTIEECHYLVEASRAKFPRLLAAVASGPTPSIDEDVFIADYINHKYPISISSFDAYLSRFDPLEPRLEQYVIVVVEDACKVVDRLSSTYTEIEAEISRIKEAYHKVPTETIIHDASCLALVDLAASEFESAGDLDHKAWFLTLDHTLGRAEHALHRKSRSMLLDELCSLMAVLTLPNSTPSPDEYVESLLSSALVSLSPDTKRAVDLFLNAVRDAGLDISNLPHENVTAMLNSLESQREAFTLLRAYRQADSPEAKQEAYRTLYALAQKQPGEESSEAEAYLSQISTLTTNLAVIRDEFAEHKAQDEERRIVAAAESQAAREDAERSRRDRLRIYIIIGIAGTLLGAALTWLLR